MTVNFRLPLLQTASLLAACLGFFSATVCQAHFVWVYGEDGKIHVVFGEGLEPGEAQFLGGIDGMSVTTLVDGKYQPLKLNRHIEDEAGWYECSMDDAGSLVNVSCEYGVFGRGDRTMLLDYGAKYLRWNSALSLVADKQMKLDIVPAMENGSLRFQAFFQGQPVKDVEFTVTRESSTTELVSDDAGVVSVGAQGRYVVRAKHVIQEKGEAGGKSFDEKRFYCTLVLDIGESGSAVVAHEQAHAGPVSDSLQVTKVDVELDELPLGMTSFGATVLDGSIYVMGGKEGKAHSYAKSYQNREVFRLSYDQESTNSAWQTVGEGLGLQGLAIVGYSGGLYRIGGLEARNAEGEEHDLHSLSDVKRFDAQSGQWSDVACLPEPRSSFDACLADGTVYVVGGWAMSGEGKPQWAESSFFMNLEDETGQWQSLETPFRTRALAVRHYQGKIYAMGGIREEGGTTSEVHIYDLKTKRWSEGPEIPSDSRMKGFGCSAVVVSNRLLLSTYEGGVFALSQDGKQWNKVHQLQNGRFFHQMLPVAENRFAMVGGAHMSAGKFYEVEIFEVSHAATAQRPSANNSENR